MRWEDGVLCRSTRVAFQLSFATTTDVSTCFPPGPVALREVLQGCLLVVELARRCSYSVPSFIALLGGPSRWGMASGVAERSVVRRDRHRGEVLQQGIL